MNKKSGFITIFGGIVIAISAVIVAALAKRIALPVVVLALIGAAGCQNTPSAGDNWPYHGVPTVKTNAIPTPNW